MSRQLTIKVFIFVTVCCELNGVQTENVFATAFTNLHRDPGPQDTTRAHIATKWIEQKLDHFDVEDNRTWKMRYMANDEFYQEGGPLFIYVGGEWAISPGAISSGHLYDMAKENRAYLLYTEHRYYGKSRPVSDLSNENMKYLHVRQALADLAHFVRTMKSSLSKSGNPKVILSGGSYSATMVTWFKKLYPELAAGCWASSAPLFAKVDFREYKEITGESIRLMGGDSCYNRIRNGINELQEMLSENRSTELKSSLNICDTFDANNKLDVWIVFSAISDIFAGLVQNHVNDTIQNACNKIVPEPDEYKAFRQFIVTSFGSGNCSDLTYKTALKDIKETKFGKGMIRQWFYQTCNEYGWYQTSASVQQPFGTKFPVALYTALCKDAYGTQFTADYTERQVNKTNAFFGGFEAGVENVYMTHGQLDPWRAVGLQEEGKATIIPSRAHCKDFGSISANDNAALKASKLRLSSLVKEWLLY